MMGVQDPPQGKLYYTNFSLDKRIRPNHPLRKIDQLIDFGFVYQEVADRYGCNGNVSLPPPIILKLMLLLVFYNVRSERELMDTIPRTNERQGPLGRQCLYRAALEKRQVRRHLFEGVWFNGGGEVAACRLFPIFQRKTLAPTL